MGMFDFDPFSEYFDLKDESDNVMMTHQALGELADMTAKLLYAWEKRAAVDHIERQEGHTPMDQGNDCSPLLLGLNLNLYQLELEDRSDLRSYSVWKLARLLGGNEEVKKLKQVIENISNFVKRIILNSVSNSLPCPMPYPVINTLPSPGQRCREHWSSYYRRLKRGREKGNGKALSRYGGDFRSR